MVDIVNTVLCGDVLQQLKTLPADYIDTVITSPPYYFLRDYGWSGQWGQEKTYQEYLEHLWSFMDEVHRVLKPTGTVWINLGDTYGDKCLLLIPSRFAIGCIERGWLLRNDLIWGKSNAMPESATDRFSRKYEHFFLFAKQDGYFFDLDGIREQHTTPIRNNDIAEKRKRAKEQGQQYAAPSGLCAFNALGKNPGDVSDFWDIPTQPSSEKHYATFGTKLIDKPIVAGCPEYICNKCGTIRKKIVSIGGFIPTGGSRTKDTPGISDEQKENGTGYFFRKFEGYSDCNCGFGFHPGIVLDPFCGTGTTIARSKELGRHYLGIEGNQDYIDIANKRLRQEMLF